MMRFKDHDVISYVRYCYYMIAFKLLLKLTNLFKSYYLMFGNDIVIRKNINTLHNSILQSPLE